MARKTISMRHVKDILRLKHQNQLSVREVARSCGLPVSTVGDYLQRAEAAGLAWPLPEDLPDSQLQARLLGGGAAQGAAPGKEVPQWSEIHEQLRRKGVTLQLLWQEYRQAHPEGFRYSRFCELYREWAGTLDPVLRQTHEPGQKLFVDWAGQTVPIEQPGGTTQPASLFVAVLGASNKTCAEAFADQQLASWIAGHCHAFSFYGGVTRAVVPDNPKTAVILANRYEPELHRTYLAMAEHYGTAILPARPKEPRDKAKVNIDYHVAVDNHFYSAPYSLIHRQLDVRLTEQTVELFYNGQRVAAHPRSRLPGKFTTLDEHRPKSHQRYLEWARQIGPQCGQVVQYILAHKPHPEAEELELPFPTIAHENIRGHNYYS